MAAVTTLQAASALLDLCAPSHESSTEGLQQHREPTVVPQSKPQQPSKEAAPQMQPEGEVCQHNWQHTLQSRHQRWQSALRYSLAFASPATVSRIAPAASLGPLDAAIFLSRLSPLDVSLLDAPVRLHVMSFQRRASALLWHNPKLSGAILKKDRFPRRNGRLC